jgi:hypothetical protein
VSQFTNMRMHDGLPVKGYKPQTGHKVALVNLNKEMEERILRHLDELPSDFDPHWLALATSHIEQGFMALNRAIFQPSRVKLPEDE